jgi:YihY family inner membrane protein
MGVAGHIILLTSVYLVLPVGRISLHHALMGGVVAGLLWELIRRILVWYFSTLSFVSVVYGSFAATIVALLSLEAGAVIILLGAQVIAEYERRQRETPVRTASAAMSTDVAQSAADAPSTAADSD